MKVFILGPALGLALLTSTAGAQTYDTICFESFDYAAGSLDNQSGGSGWFNEWWANGANHGSGNASSCDVVLPGLDGTGGMARDVLENTGAFRVPASGPWPVITENFQFGADGAEIWISFLARRSPGSDDGYGGVSLNVQFVGEKLFLGSPFGTNEWGYGDPAGGTSGTVAGSNVDQVTFLVYRITHNPGPETLDMWVDPASEHPTTPPDLTATISDIRWNEIRLQSGVFTNGHGYDFDALSITTPRLEPGTAYCFGDGSGTPCPCANAGAASEGCANSSGAGSTLSASGDASVSNDTVVLSANHLLANQPGLFFQAVNAINGGAGNPFGDGLRCAGGSVVRLEVAVADANGDAATTVAIGTKGGVAAGDLRRYQYWYRDPVGSPCGSGFNLTNGYEITWQP